MTVVMAELMQQQRQTHGMSDATQHGACQLTAGKSRQQTYQSGPSPVSLAGMPIHFRMILGTQTETVPFFLDADVAELPAVGTDLNLHFDFGPYDVLDVATAADGSVTCLIRSWDHDDVDNPPLNLECMGSDLWHMMRAGWRREMPADVGLAEAEQRPDNPGDDDQSRA